MRLIFLYNYNDILLSCTHQTHDKINAYYVHIISCLYRISYPIISLSYTNHQIGFSLAV